MRRLLWYGAAVALAGVGTVYVVGEHAKRHPHSLLARCAVFAHRVGVEYNPILKLTQAIAGKGADSDQTGITAAPADPVPSCERMARGDGEDPTKLLQPDPSDMRERDDVLNLLRTRQLPNQFHIDHDPAARLAGGEAGAIEESEDCPKTMPLSKDEDAGDAPGMMPYIPDSSSGEKEAGLSDLWRKAFGTDDDATGTAEESESINLGKPAMEPRQPSSHPKHTSSKAVCPDGDECPAHPDVDTMEFRPSDAHQGEFDRHPL